MHTTDSTAAPSASKISSNDIISKIRAEFSLQKPGVYTLQIADQIISVKKFKATGRLKTAFYKRSGKRSNAERCYLIADHLYKHDVQSHQPIAYIATEKNHCIIENYFICPQLSTSDMRAELSRILWKSQDNAELLELIRCVAQGVRKMHDSGVLHGDLGNQNILLHKNTSGEFENFTVIDLDRAIIVSNPSLKQRAKDIQRLVLPTEYLTIFYYMYFNDGDIPSKFESWAHAYRKQYIRHDKTRKYRHPIRHFRQRHQQDLTYPCPRDIWLWDEKSAQPMIALDKKTKNKYRSYSQYFTMAKNCLVNYFKLKRNYQVLLQSSFASPVNFAEKIGIAIHPHQDYCTKELALLEQLGNPPVLIRFCCHESPQQWQQTIELIEHLHNKHISVAVALLQNRKAVALQSHWQDFLAKIIPAIHDKVRWVEIGHAINRVKWGIWHYQQYNQLVQLVTEYKQQYPHLKLIGPAVIDFEWPWLLNTLVNLPKSTKLYAASQHLYVDRRSAPENKQGNYSTLEKCALGKAITKLAPSCDNRYIISEVNWPIKHTGIYSPIGSPYTKPEWMRHPPGETEEDYAAYMVRYLAIALCSGHVDEVYWWRLSAHGYGLVDDLDQFRPRPAFYAMKQLLQQCAQAQFICRLPSDKDTYLLQCESTAQKFIIAWSLSQSKCHSDLKIKHTINLVGNPIDIPQQLPASPVYLILRDHP